jgi:hypothetical protein
MVCLTLKTVSPVAFTSLEPICSTRSPQSKPKYTRDRLAALKITDVFLVVRRSHNLKLGEYKRAENR